MAYKFETLAIHSGHEVDKIHGSVVNPVCQTAGYIFPSTDSASKRFALEEEGQIYSRVSNPTVDAFEAKMAVLDGGIAAVATASGMTAITYAVMNICRAGDNIVSSPNLYGGVSNLFKNILKDYGIEVRFVEHDDPENFRKAADDNTRLFWGETIPNPKLNVFPIHEVSKIGDEMGIPLMIDNTCATPVMCKALEQGAHIAVYSATKYIGGHGNAIGGVVVDSGRFDWATSRFPMLNEPDASYHGIVWADKFKEAAFITKYRATMLRDMGGCMAPMNAFLFNQGLETLSLRMERHCENAFKLAKHLEGHPKVNAVVYPGLAEGNTKKWADMLLSGMYGGMLGVDVKGGTEAGQKVVESLKVFKHVANIGDTRSMAIHPASTTHAQVPQAERMSGGITDGYLRVCVGIEHVEDLIADWDNALAQI